jgi:hypothetical protein
MTIFKTCGTIFLKKYYNKDFTYPVAKKISRLIFLSRMVTKVYYLFFYLLVSYDDFSRLCEEATFAVGKSRD